MAEEARLLARLRILDSQDNSKARYDGHYRHVTYLPGEFVWLWRSIRKRGLYQKMLVHYAGRYVVIDQLSDLNYRIARVSASGRRSEQREVTHIARLKPCHARNAD